MRSPHSGYTTDQSDIALLQLFISYLSGDKSTLFLASFAHFSYLLTRGDIFNEPTPQPNSTMSALV